MQLEHEFIVPVPADQAWEVLLDVERMAPCMPGATIDSVDGDTFTGRVKVKVGPVTVSYSGSASFVEKDAEARKVVVEAKGKETRGAGTAAATVTAQLHEAGSDTRVTVVTDLAITGRPAQFGRGVMDDVGKKLLGQFSECVATQLSAAGPSRPAEGAAATSDSTEGASAGAAEGGAEHTAGGNSGEGAEQPSPRPTPDAINVFNVAGASVAKRLAPVLAVIIVVLGVVALILVLG
ncbi:MAG: SRPBCC family protein [Jiangellaceae bacterium]